MFSWLGVVFSFLKVIPKSVWKYLGILIVSLAILLGSYQLGYKDAKKEVLKNQVSDQSDQISKLQSDAQKTLETILMDLEEVRSYNLAISNELLTEIDKTNILIEGISNEEPIVVTGDCSVNYGSVRLLNKAATAREHSDSGSGD